MKRAVLSLARQRADILHTLDSSKLQSLVKAGFPVDDRKVRRQGGGSVAVASTGGVCCGSVGSAGWLSGAAGQGRRCLPLA